MLQIVIWMLCVYLVLKGKELQYIAAASSHESREHNIASARLWATISYISAGIFLVLSIVQGNSMPSSVSGLGGYSTQRDATLDAAKRFEERLANGEINMSDPEADNLLSGSTGVNK